MKLRTLYAKSAEKSMHFKKKLIFYGNYRIKTGKNGYFCECFYIFTAKSRFIGQLPIVFVGANCVRPLLGPGGFLLRAITDRPYNVV